MAFADKRYSLYTIISMSHFIHGDNIATKLRDKQSPEKRRLLSAISARYELWKQGCLRAEGSKDSRIKELVRLTNSYKKYLDDIRFKCFTAQGKLHSSVLEEFMYYIFQTIPSLRSEMDMGQMEAYTNLFFAPKSLNSLQVKSGIQIHKKNQDFAIAKKVFITAATNERGTRETETVHIPVISIECKTYVDKTMYESSVATAERIKQGNPYSKYYIVTELYAIGDDVDPKHSKIDQIYVLRKQKRNKTNGLLNNICDKIVLQLYDDVFNHVSSDWSNMENRVRTGLMI
jgi:hypothetical protein